MSFKCNICNRNFETEESLKQHNSIKHAVIEKKPKSIKKYVIIFSLILIIGIVSYTFYVRAATPGNYDDFAKCLTEKEVSVYGNDYCQYTNRQLNLFGKSKKYLNYIKCIDNTKLCDDKGIETTPTWEINGKMYEQVQSLESIASLSGCELK